MMTTTIVIIFVSLFFIFLFAFFRPRRRRIVIVSHFPHSLSSLLRLNVSNVLAGAGSYPFS